MFAFSSSASKRSSPGALPIFKPFIAFFISARVGGSVLMSVILFATVSSFRHWVDWLHTVKNLAEVFFPSLLPFLAIGQDIPFFSLQDFVL